MDYFINLASFCNEINLNNESAMFFVYEGSIKVKRQENEFYIDFDTANTLRLISEIKNELGVNDEGASVILNLRDKVIDYQNKIKIILEAMDKSKSIDELIFILKNNNAFKNFCGNSNDNDII
ncbi:MAG: hypothetical protein ACYCSQ_03805 [bacterium]